jgi:hypothetical protein
MRGGLVRDISRDRVDAQAISDSLQRFYSTRDNGDLCTLVDEGLNQP